MIKEDNLGDTNEFYSTFHEVNNLNLENYKMELKERKFYRMKNKD